MKWKNKLIFVSLIVFSTQIFAEPSLEPSAAAQGNLSKIKNTTMSNVMADESNPELFYVLPPNTGYGYTEGIHSRTANMGFCSEMSKLQRYSDQLLDQIDQLERKKSELISVMAPILEAASELRVKAAQYATDNQMISLLKIDETISSLKERLDELYEKRSSCQGTLCDSIDLEIYETQKNKASLDKQRSDLIIASGNAGKQYKKYTDAAAAKEAQALAYKKPYEDIQDTLWKTKDKYFSAYATYGKLEGARSFFTYESGWQNNVATLRTANPQFSFELAKTKNAHIMPELMIKTVDPTASILQINIPGQTEENGVATLASFPETISANVVLSNIGACPIEDPASFRLSLDGTKAKFGVVASYDYATVFKSQVTATFNMRKVFQRIEQTSSKRRLLNSSTSRTISERNDYNDVITFTWEDRSNAIDPKVKEQKEALIRSSIFTRIAYLALPNANNRAQILNAGPIPASGASVVSSTLYETCPTNVYCVGAAVGLTILDNLFGGGSSSTNFTSIKDVNLEERYTSIGSIDHSTSTSYKF